MGEKLLKLARKLCGERLVGRHDERWLTQSLDGLCHGVGLARARYAKQHLIAVPILNPLDEGGDSLGLVARGLKRRDNLKGNRIARDAKALELAADALDFKLLHVILLIRRGALAISPRSALYPKGRGGSTSDAGDRYAAEKPTTFPPHEEILATQGTRPNTAPYSAPMHCSPAQDTPVSRGR